MSQYRTYITRGFIILLVALGIAVLVFVFVQFLLVEPAAPSTDSVTAPTAETEAAPANESSGSAPTREVELSDSAPPAGIYLRDLPLTDGQRKTAELVGIEVDTYYISPETISCIESEISPERYEAIKGGEVPSFVETTKLVKCL